MYAPHGTMRRDGAMVHDMVLVKVKAPADSKEPWDFYDILGTVSGVEAFPRIEDEACEAAR